MTLPELEERSRQIRDYIERLFADVDDVGSIAIVVHRAPDPAEGGKEVMWITFATNLENDSRNEVLSELMRQIDDNKLRGHVVRRN